jgi:pimeloyl-ACP methyl ester carboxylesterase
MSRPHALCLTLLLVPHLGLAATELARRSTADERYPGVDVIYDAVGTQDGKALRMILTRPHAADRALPTVFVAGWLSCDSVEAPPGTHDATGHVFQALAQMPGFVTVRVDKPGVGDSQGLCAETDFTAELSGYRSAFRALSRYSFIDRDSVFLLGISNGGGFAPLVPEGAPVRGYVVDGGWVKTWYEHMLEIERRRLTLSGKTPGEVNEEMRSIGRFYAAYLLEGTAPREILRQHPELASVWDADLDHQYGRPIAYYQQLQQLNLAEAWSRVKVPTLVLQGEFDWIMSRQDHELIATLVNHNAPGAATFLALPNTGHSFDHYASLDAAFHSHEEPFDPKVAHVLTDWFEQHRPGAH